MTRFLQHLFGFHVTETRGERLFSYAFELFVAACTLKYAWTWALHVQDLGDVVLPLGIANYVDVSVLFQSWVAHGVAVLLTGAVVLGALRWWRYGYLAALLLLHLLFAARYSQGEIPHSSNVLGMTLMGLGLAVPAFDTELLRRRFAIGFAYFSVGIGYTSAAVCKLVGTGLHWVDGRHLQLWIHEKSIDVFAASGTFDFTLLQSLALDYYWIATLFLVIGLVSESLAFSMWWPRFRVPAVLAVLGLHAGIYLTMRIVFAITTLELILLALPWACIVTRIAGMSASTRERECPLPHLRPAPSPSPEEASVSAPSAS
ncbi:MAG: hypothetical protein ACLFTE_06185 [Salinivenus sp.]